jgi:predicted permease
MGVVIPVFSYLAATLAIKPAGVAPEQRSAFRFAIMAANTAFLGIPICEALFGPLGAVYAVLYDFGTTLVAFTLGIWELRGGRLGHWRPLLVNPLILGVLAGLAWAMLGWRIPMWLAAPLERLGNTTLPLALLVGGAQIGNVHARGLAWPRQLAGLTVTRLVVIPLAVAGGLALTGSQGLFASVVVLESAMPAGLSVAIMAKTYGADAEFAASALLWTTLAAIISLPLVALLLA